MNNISYPDALKELAKEYKIPINEEDKKTIKAREIIENVLSTFTELCHENLLNSEYLEDLKDRRGFSEDIIKEYKIGLFDNSIKPKLKKMFNNAQLVYAGLLSKKEKWYFGKRIVYPYFSSSNEPNYFIFRLIDSEPDFMKKAKYIKIKKTKFVKEILFGFKSLNRKNNDILILTEGITDCISVIQTEYPCLSPVTIRFKKEDHIKILNYAKRFKKVCIINDNEENEQGKKGAEDTLKFLMKNGIKAFIGIIPNPDNLEKIDLDDYLKEDGKNRIKSLIDKSIEGFEYIIKDVDTTTNDDDLIDICKSIPFEAIRKKNDIINKLVKKTKMGKRDINAIYKIASLEVSNEFNEMVRENNEKTPFSPNLVADDILTKHIILSPKEFTKKILLYTNGCWNFTETAILEKIILEYFEENEISICLEDSAQNSKLNMVKKYIRIKTLDSIHNFDNNELLINVRNCLINIDEKSKEITTLEHDPKHKFTKQIQVDYKPELEYNDSTIIEFLKQIHYSNDMKLVQQLEGLDLTPIIKFQKHTLDIGSGANGKDTKFALNRRFYGKRNTANIDLAEYEKDFYGSQIIGKNINYCTEISTNKISNLRKIKEIMGGSEHILVNDKYEVPYSYKPTIKNHFCCNDTTPNIPESAGKGLFRKITIIEYPNSFDGENQKINLLNDLTNDIEFSKILNWKLEGLISLLTEGFDFDNCVALHTWEDVKEFWFKNTTPIAAFLDEICEVGEYKDATEDKYNKFWSERDETHDIFNIWRKKNLKPNISKHKLTNWITTNSQTSNENRNKKRIYAGFYIKPEFKKKKKNNSNTKINTFTK